MLGIFWSWARPYRGLYAAGFLLLLLTNGLSLAIPWLLRAAVNALERGQGLRVVSGLAAGMAGVALLQAAVRTASRLAVLGASRRIVYDVRNLFFAHLQRLGATFYDAWRTGDIMSRGINDVQLLRSFYGPGVLNLLNTTIVYAAVLVLLARIDPLLTLVSFLLYPPLFLAVNRLSRRVYARSLAVQEQLAELSNRAQENLAGIQQVKVYAQEESEVAGFRDLCAEYRQRNLSMASLRGAMLALIGVVAGAGTLLVLFLGGRHVIEGRITLGDFVAFNAYLGLLVWPTIALGWIVNVFQRGAGALRRLNEILSLEPDIPPADEDEESVGAEPLDGDIEIRGLTFSYPAGETGERAVPSLRDVSLTIERGSRVAFVGSVGSGKSTLVNLLARVYPAPPGTIFIGGTDIREVPVARLRRSLGYVPQEAFLFSRSLRENIALGRPGASDEEIGEAVALSHLAEDVGLLPDGLHTLVGERGVTLSGGQRQRATLARAAVVDPRILILDDSLSSVDADTERAILGRLQEAGRGRTCLLVSHRLSTLAGVDRIVVLDRGRIVEDGTHEELMARQGLYTRLFRRHLLEESLEAS